ncbi:unnamed protein product [Prorocentrum cordatum]|uniref:Uncharacterized protein n=1 Tax=Prorocentrum cordatum TaxID=2364126 RepID=A0ABN9V961_9DINO|nr:unnamed protein product [Polarella glacialis]
MAPAMEEDEPPTGAAGDAAAQSPSVGAAAGTRRSRPGHSPGARRGAAPDGADNPFEKVENLMKARDFRTAEAALRAMLKATPEDDRVMHYLGVLLTEECRYEEAETVFQGAFDAQEKAGKVNYATAFGLATVLTEIGGMEKLLQGEALFRDVLARAVEQAGSGAPWRAGRAPCCCSSSAAVLLLLLPLVRPCACESRWCTLSGDVR